MIKRLFLLVGFSMFLNITARAQDFPKAEMFGGYSYGNFGPVISGAGRTNLNGWNASLGVNMNRWFGLVSDFSGHYGSSNGFIPFPPIPCTPTACGFSFSENDKYHSFLFGPQFSLRTKKLTPFVHALFGGTRLNRSGTETLAPPPPGTTTTSNFSASTMTFAFGGGGGADYKFSDKFAWRIQADYLGTGTQTRTLNNIRISTGLVLHF
jgi:opacity protein-like surface antigen